MAAYPTINQNCDFRRTYGRGKSYVCPFLVLYCTRNRCGFSRFGITVSKKIGKAVQRNRAKRLINAALCENLDSVKDGCDIVLVARVRTSELNSGELARHLQRLLRSADMLKPKKKPSHQERPN